MATLDRLVRKDAAKCALALGHEEGKQPLQCCLCRLCQQAQTAIGDDGFKGAKGSHDNADTRSLDLARLLPVTRVGVPPIANGGEEANQQHQSLGLLAARRDEAGCGQSAGQPEQIAERVVLRMRPRLIDFGQPLATEPDVRPVLGRARINGSIDDRL